MRSETYMIKFIPLYMPVPKTFLGGRDGINQLFDFLLTLLGVTSSVINMLQFTIVQGYQHTLLLLGHVVVIFIVFATNKIGSSFNNFAKAEFGMDWSNLCANSKTFANSDFLIFPSLLFLDLFLLSPPVSFISLGFAIPIYTSSS